jgi:hypothetical protein
VAILAKQQQQPGQQGHSSQPLTPQPLGLEIGSDQLLGSLTPVPPSPQPAAASSCDGGGRGTSYKVSHFHCSCLQLTGQLSTLAPVCCS